jgi:gluconolactonase
VLVVEIAAGRITRVRPDGAKEVVSMCGGGPNGAAIGPDGALYVANSGGMEVYEQEDGTLFSTAQPSKDYKTGSIQRIDLATGEATTLYTHCDGRQLWGPNDIVFDAHGGFYFTDFGKHFSDHVYLGGLFYAKADGSAITRLYDQQGFNGVGISADGRTLYASQTYERLLLEFDIVAPGKLDEANPLGRVTRSFPNRQALDSLALTADGSICVAQILDDPGIAMVDPRTGKVDHFPFPDVYTTNICFGGEDMRDAYITLTTTGKLIKTRWDRPGLKLNHYA